MEINALELSKKLLLCIRQNQNYEKPIQELHKITTSELAASLIDDAIKKAFWINIFNAYGMILLAANPNIITTERGRIKHFNKKKILISDVKLSLYDILHGYIRSSKAIWGKGYFRKIFVSCFEKQFRVGTCDPRIHFAVNYGGQSFPIITVFDSETIESQLETGTNEYLTHSSIFLEDKNLISVPPQFIWYMGDFGGMKGILKFLKRYHMVPPKEYPNLHFKNCDWTPNLNKFA